MLEYRRYGRGGVLMEVPRGLPPARAAATERTASLLLRRAAEDGVRVAPSPPRSTPRPRLASLRRSD